MALTKKQKIVLYVLFVFSLLATIIFTLVTYPRWLTSDMTAELIAAKQALTEGGLLSPNWYYGTELRLLSPTLVYQFLFLFTSNFQIVRMISIPIVLALFLLSLFFLMRQAGYQDFFPLIGTCLLFPFAINSSYFTYVISGYQMYAFYLALMFITIGLLFYFFKHDDKVHRIITIILISLIGMVSGINSLRHTAIFYLPLLISTAIIYLIGYLRYQDKQKNQFRWLVGLSGIALLANGIGDIIYVTVMQSHFHIFSFSFALQPSWSNVVNLFKMIGECLGFDGSGNVFAVLSCITCVCSIIFIIIYLIGLPFFYSRLNIFDQLLSAFFVVGCLSIFFVFVFFNIGADNGYRIIFPQYLLFNLIFAFFLIPIFFQHYYLSIFKDKINNTIKVSFLTFFLAITACSYSVYFGFGQERYSYKYKALSLTDVVTFLNARPDYKIGYASHWNGILLTELTNQQVEMYIWKAVNGQLMINPEVQSTAHDDFFVDRPCFALFSEYEHGLYAYRNAKMYGELVVTTEEYEMYSLPTAIILSINP